MSNKRGREDASSSAAAAVEDGASVGDGVSEAGETDGGDSAAVAAAPKKKAKVAKEKKWIVNPRTDYLQTMANFWEKELEASSCGYGANGSKSAPKPVLPLARIKKIIKNDEDVRSTVMISGEAPFLISRACELFTLDLTMRAWAHTDATMRRTLQRSDVADAIASTEQFDFLLDIVPRDEHLHTTQPIPISTSSMLSNFQQKQASQQQQAQQQAQAAQAQAQAQAAAQQQQQQQQHAAHLHHQQQLAAIQQQQAQQAAAAAAQQQQQGVAAAASPYPVGASPSGMMYPPSGAPSPIYGGSAIYPSGVTPANGLASPPMYANYAQQQQQLQQQAHAQGANVYQTSS